RVVWVDRDTRAGGARRHARLIAVRHAVIALVCDPAGARDPRRAGAERERVLLLQPRLEVLLEGWRVGLDLDHVDRAVRAGLRARRAAGAGRLVAHDLAPVRVEPDRVGSARIDAPLVGAGPARVDEVEHAELVAAEGQPARAVALLARLLAQLAVDAQVELADPDDLAGDADAL